MSDPYIGEIRMFAGNFAPKNWALCDGQILAVAEHTALFSLLGAAYGGDGRTSFGLPDLRGRLPMHFGQGSGLTPRALGQRFGSETVTLTDATVPPHNHFFMASEAEATDGLVSGNILGTTPDGDNFYIDSGTMVNLLPETIQSAGGGKAHPNLMPFLCINFIISLKGQYPPRN